ncbi:metallophosphoesterase [Oceanobacillus picturae]|uniref:Metallophosphoesterase n=2 Tax=Oceanobacillus picturae TaxID=171693 RepID=A0A0U9H2S8_9BACI|nr:metallophosphoesterase [Oceanobacillus picturae]
MMKISVSNSLLSAIMIFVLCFSNSIISIEPINAEVQHDTDQRDIPPLLITEIVPDSTDIEEVDGYEFIEVYNNTNHPLSFDEYQIIYRYPVGAENDRFWMPNKRDIEIPSGETLVLWIENAENKNISIEDFNDHYGVNLVENKDIVRMPGGMANQRMRDILIRTNTGEEVVMAQYNRGVYDVAENMGIFYQYPVDGSNQMVKVSAGSDPATPGTIEADLVPEVPIEIAADTAPIIENMTVTSQPMDKVEVIAEASDDFLLSTMTLYYKDENSEGYQSLNLEMNDEDGTYSHRVPVNDLIGVKELEYYFEASNGLNRSTTEVNTIDITEAVNGETLPLLITEVVPDSSNFNGADGYEFIEVYNNTDQVVDFENYHVLYRYLTGSPDAIWFENLTDIHINPGDNLVLWVDNGKNEELTVADFNANYGTELVENEDIVKASAGGGMANGSKRELIVASKAGDEVVIAGYNKDEPDSAPNKGIFYHFPYGSKEMIKVGSREKAATPGTIEENLVPADLMEIDLELGPVIDNRTEVDTVKQGDSVEIKAYAQDSLHVSVMTLFYKHSMDESYESVNLTREEDRLFHHTVDIGEDAPEGSIDYYFVASNGFVETNSTNHSIGIEIENSPDVPVLFYPENGSSDMPTDTELSVEVSNQYGGSLDVGFYQGRSYNTTQLQRFKIFQNAADVEPPLEMVPDGEVEFTTEEYSKLSAINNEQVETDSDEQFPYHRFEVTLDEEELQEEMVEVVWHGSSLDGRKVNMYAWNIATEKWTVVDSFVPDSTDTFSLKGEVDVNDYVRDGKLNAIVQDEIPPRAEYDYTFVWLSDTQFYSEVFPDLYETQVGWVQENKDTMDIEYVFHTGDIVNTYNQMYQWEFADQFMGVLENASVPYGVLAGNHDVELPNMGYDNYSQYFGEDRFQDQPYYGDSYQNNRGHYDLISSHGNDFIMLYMGWQPDDEGIAWMNEVLAEYPDRIAILNFHQYLNAAGNRTAIADQLFEEVVVPNENVKLVLGGHYHGSEVLVDTIDDDGDGIEDRKVHQLLGNFQDAERGGDGYMNIMNFDTENNLIYINTYSTDLDSYDLFEPYTVSLNLEPMTKRVSTDFFEVNVYSSEEIATVSDIPSGERATVNWDGLDDGETYYWYASVRNEAGVEAISNMWHFTTEESSSGETDISGIRTLIQEFIDSGDIKNPLASQLTNTLRQAEHHYDRGNVEQAIKFMEKSLKQIDKKEQLISSEAKTVLQETVDALLEQWESGDTSE